MEFTATREQGNAIEALAYWIADLHYIRERYGEDEPEIETARKTIEKSCFPECDKLNIPFWVQNTVIAYSENWRRYKETYTRNYLKTKNIYI